MYTCRIVFNAAVQICIAGEQQNEQLELNRISVNKANFYDPITPY